MLGPIRRLGGVAGRVGWRGAAVPCDLVDFRPELAHCQQFVLAGYGYIAITLGVSRSSIVVTFGGYGLA